MGADEAGGRVHPRGRVPAPPRMCEQHACAQRAKHMQLDSGAARTLSCVDQARRCHLMLCASVADVSTRLAEIAAARLCTTGTCEGMVIHVSSGLHSERKRRF